MIKKTYTYNTKLKLVIALFALVLTMQHSYAQTFCTQDGKDQYTGVKDGYRYELWNQNAKGTACMTIGDGALFSGEWSGIENYLARRGLKYNETQEHQDIGLFYSSYNCNYNPTPGSGGNSYLSIYGWTVDPLIEFYIVEDWRNWIPSMAAGAVSKGTIDVNGSIYDIYENTRVNQPSIKGNTTFQQYFSIRRDVRNSGTISITEHFDMWESLGMDLGKMYEVSFVVEGYKSNGNFEFTELDVFLSDTILPVKELPIKNTNISIYQNTNSGNIAIELDETISNATIRIYDEAGRIVFTEENTNESKLDVSGLKNGIYILNVKSNKLDYKTKL
ncbi:MAG: glycoside hydrolase family 11 protein [Prolixibacteraceae bacterium]|jgi:endo-1,4-beta-xylanase|nr:glycoside hydrolase family 11 protein [Prolixibacteraceae bacterium]